MTGSKYNAVSFEDVKRAASGRWPEVLQYLGMPADALTGKHTPCPGCGGRDRFRWDDNRQAFFCNGGGNLTGGDGFSLLNHCGWAKADALHAVAQFFRVKKVMLSPEQREEMRQRKLRAKQAKYEAVLCHELHVLLQVLTPRVASRELADNKNFRKARPEYVPPPNEHWEREIQAANRVQSLIGKLYGVAA